MPRFNPMGTRIIVRRGINRSGRPRMGRRRELKLMLRRNSLLFDRDANESTAFACPDRSRGVSPDINPRLMCSEDHPRPGPFENQHQGQTWLKNSSWSLIDQASRAALGAIVVVALGRYLGPTDFGVLSFVVATTKVFAIAAALGLDRIVVERLVTAPELAE